MTKRLPIFGSANPRKIRGYDGSAAAGGEGEAGESVTLDQVKTLITDQLKGVENKLNSTVNNAISNLKKSDLPKIVQDAMAPMTEQLSGLSDLLKTNNSGSGSGSGGSGGSGSGGSGSGSGGSNHISPEVNAEMKGLKTNLEAMTKQIKSLEDAKVQAEQNAERSEKHSQIRMGLAGLAFASESAAETAFSLVEPHVKRTDDGQLIGGENLPLQVFFKDFVTKEHPYLLKAVGASGAGASGGSGSGGRMAVADMSMIRAGMTPAERDLVMKSIQQAASELRK